jgi:hypothetical protein
MTPFQTYKNRAMDTDINELKEMKESNDTHELIKTNVGTDTTDITNEHEDEHNTWKVNETSLEDRNKMYNID